MDTGNVGYSYYLPSGGWNYKIRNTLSQFSDLFSEFNKYIAPAYHHDRCDRWVMLLNSEYKSFIEPFLQKKNVKWKEKVIAFCKYYSPFVQFLDPFRCEYIQCTKENL